MCPEIASCRRAQALQREPEKPPKFLSTLAFVASLNVQLFLAPVFWLLVVGTGATLSRELSEDHIAILETLLYILPSIPLLSCAILTICFLRKAKPHYLVWNLLSVAGGIGFWVYVLNIK